MAAGTAGAFVIVIETLSGDVDGDRYMALVELEVGHTCCHCHGEIPAGHRAVFLAVADRPVQIAHLRTECSRPPAKRRPTVLEEKT